jgi:hypothetical protein
MISVKKALVALILAALVAPVALGQSKTEDSSVEEKGFKSKIFEVKYGDPNGLASVLRSLGSGLKGSTMSADRDYKTITVRDFPENIAVIEEALRRLDKPQPPTPDIEFHIHALIASGATGQPDEYPAELTDVIKALQSTLRYKSYGLMASSIQRGNGRASVENSGVAESKLFNVTNPQSNPIFFHYNAERVSLDATGASDPLIQIGKFSFGMRFPINLGSQIQYENVGFNTPVRLRPGEKVVVGTTTIGDKALVIVLIATVVK